MAGGRRLFALVSVGSIAAGIAFNMAAIAADTGNSVPIAASFAPQADPSTTPTTAGPTTTTEAPATTTTVAPTTTTEAPPTTSVAPRVSAATSAPQPAPAPAPTTPAEVGAAALASLDYPWQRLGYSVTFEGANSGLLGKADCGTHQITVYVRPTQTIQQVAFVAAFELGHAVDCGTMTTERRAQWAAIRGFAPGWTWFPGCLCTEDNFGSGDISMVFANWLVPGGHRWRSNLAGPPSAEQMQQLLPFLQVV